MLIEEELMAHLEGSLRDGQNKARDRQIIAFYYGFGDISWPTLEDVANKFGLNERERVRQIVKNKFQAKVTKDSLPSASRIGGLIEGYDFISTASVRQRLADERLAPTGINIRGLLNLLEDLGLCSEFNIYDASLRPVSRSASDTESPSFLVRGDYLPRLKKALGIARTLPGLLGLARTDYLNSALVDPDESTLLNIAELLHSSTDCLHFEAEGQQWYTFEGRDNTLVNSCEKLFGVIYSSDAGVLSEVLANSLLRRTNRFKYPSASVIKQFLEISSLFQRSGSEVAFLGQPGKLTEIEQAVVAFLREHALVDYPTLRDHLEGKGYGRPIINKSTICSPLVYVNKAGGRAHYTYQLVPTGRRKDHEFVDARYLRILARMQRLLELGTDVSVESTRRREQGILQDWLFEDRSVGKCAICGNTFSTEALVAAHKKKRSICSDQERIDPYIVMPLCVFGCDYLYEAGVIEIAEGKLRIGRRPPELTREAELADALNGRLIDEIWLRGSPTYFYR